jgi:hypothetical protein
MELHHPSKAYFIPERLIWRLSLAPAPGRQDHTISPSASNPSSARIARCELIASTASSAQRS